MCKKKSDEEKKENGFEINKGLLIFCLSLLAIIVIIAIVIGTVF